jgi:hypothetical protein
MLLDMYRVFKKDLYNVIRNVTVWCRTVDGLYVFMCKCFRNTRHSIIWNIILTLFLKHPVLPVEVTLNPSKTLCILLHYDSSKHCTCPLSKFI